ncbi:MAG: cohesin domain-containing protein, partial [bacterium]
NPSTAIRFGVPQASHVTLKVCNVLSEEMATLVNEQKSAGIHVVDFTPKNLPSGIYFYALTAGDVRLVRRMVYAK